MLVAICFSDSARLAVSLCFKVKGCTDYEVVWDTNKLSNPAHRTQDNNSLFLYFQS